MSWEGPACCIAGFVIAGCAAAAPAEVTGVDVTPSAKPTARAASDDTVRFVYTPEQAGDVCDENRSVTREMVVKDGAEIRRWSTTLDSRVRYEVLESKNGVSVRERVFYQAYDETGPNGPRPPPPTLQTMYVVALEHGNRVVRDDGGAPVSPPETDWMMDHWQVGERETLGDIFDKLALRPGDQVPGLAGRYLQRVDKRATIKSQSYEFRGLDSGSAWVEVRIEGELAVPDQPARVVSLDGTIRVAVPRGTILAEEYDFIFPHTMQDGLVLSIRERLRYSRTRSRVSGR